MNKLLCVILAAVCFSLILPGCTSITFDSEIQPKGDIINQSYIGGEIGEFTALDIQIPGLIYLTVGEPSVKIEAYENQMEIITVNNDGGKLTIGTNASESHASRALGHDSPTIRISAPALTRLEIIAADIKEADKIAGEKFELIVEGAAYGKLDFDVKDLTVDLAGASYIELSGTTEKAVITTAGASSLNAYGLEIKDAKVILDGVGTVQVTCTDTLDAEANGVGTISYRGGATVTKNVNGLGSIMEA